MSDVKYGVLSDLIDNEINFVNVVVDCPDEEHYIGALDRLGIERNDVIDTKSKLTYTTDALPNGFIFVQYESGPVDVDEESDEEE